MPANLVHVPGGESTGGGSSVSSFRRAFHLPMVPRWGAIANAGVGLAGEELPEKPQKSGLFCLPLQL